MKDNCQRSISTPAKEVCNRGKWRCEECKGHCKVGSCNQKSVDLLVLFILHVQHFLVCTGLAAPQDIANDWAVHYRLLHNQAENGARNHKKVANPFQGINLEKN